MNDEFLEQFRIINFEFVTDDFEEMGLQDVYRYDKETLEKISRDITETFKNWIKKKVNGKENISISIKGSTRSGKSLCGLNITDYILSFYDSKDFDTKKIVCGNQKEYRQKLKDSSFGDVLQIDENAFTNVGMGSATEMLQLKDVQNIIAKKNIHTIYITPRRFLDSNSILGLSSYGKDIKNWLSRFLVYDLRKPHFNLLGYIIIDIGKIFRKYNCYCYKVLGGCTNPSKKTINEIPKENILYSTCINEHTENELLNDGKSCPFYNVCSHPLCMYEHKKDDWINKEMCGGIDERVSERYETAVKLLKKLAYYDKLQRNYL
jgi:hypothetical protein